MKNLPPRLSIELTVRCNHDCPFCYGVWHESPGLASRELDTAAWCAILDECARELYAETTRWMDLRRTRQLIRYNVAYNHYIESAEDMCNSLGEQKWYRPIPAAEIQNNIAITEKDQNPGY